MNALILALVLAVMVAVEQAIPINSTNTIPGASEQNTLSTLTKIALHEVVEVYQGVVLLGISTGEQYDAPYQGCYKRFVSNNDADVNTLKDDVKSFNQLLPVIQDLANNETHKTAKADYEKIIYSMNASIAALNNLIAALENNDDEDEAIGPTNAEQTSPCVDDDTDADADSESETDHCAQLDKAAKLHALKDQAHLTLQDISIVSEKTQTS